MGRVFVAVEESDDAEEQLLRKALKFLNLRGKDADQVTWDGPLVSLTTVDDFSHVLGPDAKELGTLTEPREFNLMFKTYVGALSGEEGAAFLRPETAQGIFVNFKNVVDSTRVRVPFGIAQIGKSFRNEITPRNFTFRSREFEQMEIEFFCHPEHVAPMVPVLARSSFSLVHRTRAGRATVCRLRDHDPDELSHYSTGTADIEYAFPFLPAGAFGELEGIAHRGDFDLRSHMEGKLDPNTQPLEVEKDEHGRPRGAGSGKDLSYRDDLSGRTVRAARHRALGGCRSSDAGVSVRSVPRRRGAGRKRQAAVARRDAIASPHRADQGRRLSAGQKGRHARDGTRYLSSS